MKKISAFFLSLFAATAVTVSAQMNLNDLGRAIAEDRENAASLVEEAVEANPGQINQIVSRLLAEFPDLAEEIILGAVAGLPEPISVDDVASLVYFAVQFNPALAPEIVLGARRATVGMDMRDRIDAAAATALRERGALPGQTSAPSGPQPDFNETLRISPSRNG